MTRNIRTAAVSSVWILALAELGAVCMVLISGPSTARADQPACNNSNHARSSPPYTCPASPLGSWQMRCAASNRKGPGYDPDTGLPYYSTHSPSPVGSTGATPN